VDGDEEVQAGRWVLLRGVLLLVVLSLSLCSNWVGYPGGLRGVTCTSCILAIRSACEPDPFRGLCLGNGTLTHARCVRN
jgi:hypothetical protein